MRSALLEMQCGGESAGASADDDYVARLRVAIHFVMLRVGVGPGFEPPVVHSMSCSPNDSVLLLTKNACQESGG
jgi:hypothetical protein